MYCSTNEVPGTQIHWNLEPPCRFSSASINCPDGGTNRRAAAARVNAQLGTPSTRSSNPEPRVASRRLAIPCPTLPPRPAPAAAAAADRLTDAPRPMIPPSHHHHPRLRHPSTRSCRCPACAVQPRSKQRAKPGTLAAARRRASPSAASSQIIPEAPAEPLFPGSQHQTKQPHRGRCSSSVTSSSDLHPGFNVDSTSQSHPTGLSRHPLPHLCPRRWPASALPMAAAYARASYFVSSSRPAVSSSSTSQPVVSSLRFLSLSV